MYYWRGALAKRTSYRFFMQYSNENSERKFQKLHTVFCIFIYSGSLFALQGLGVKRDSNHWLDVHLLGWENPKCAGQMWQEVIGRSPFVLEQLKHTCQNDEWYHWTQLKFGAWTSPLTIDVQLLKPTKEPIQPFSSSTQKKSIVLLVVLDFPSNLKRWDITDGEAKVFLLK